MNSFMEKFVSSSDNTHFINICEDIWSWSPFDRFPWTTVLRFSDDRVMALRCKKEGGSTDELVRIAQAGTVSWTVSVSPDQPSTWMACDASRLGGVAIRHPSIAKSSPLNKEHDWAAGQTWRVFVAGRCEVGLDESPDEVEARSKVWDMTDLTRDVTPFTKTRSLRKKSKIRAGGAGKSRGVGRWTEVVRVFELLAEEDGFLEIENYEREVARVDHEGGYVITLRDTEYEREPADARAWREAFAKQGVEASLEVLAP